MEACQMSVENFRALLKEISYENKCVMLKWLLLWCAYEMKVWNQSPNPSGWEGPWGDIWSNLEHVAQDCIQMVLECPLWSTCSICGHLHSKKVLPHVQVELLCISFCLFPLVLYVLRFHFFSLSIWVLLKL